MALVQISVLTKNTEDHVKTYLFNTDRIVDFYASSATIVTFYYKDINDGRTRTDKYTTTLTKAQFEALFNETLYVTRLDLPILEIYTPVKQTVTRVVNVAVSEISKAWDISTTTCYLEFTRSDFQTVRLLVDATIAEIESSSSTSVSIAV